MNSSTSSSKPTVAVESIAVRDPPRWLASDTPSMRDRASRIAISSAARAMGCASERRSRNNASVVGDRDEEDEDVELELVEASAGRVADPLHLRVEARGERVLPSSGGHLTGVEPRVDAHDVRVLRGDAQDLRAATADQDRWVR